MKPERNCTKINDKQNQQTTPALAKGDRAPGKQFLETRIARYIYQYINRKERRNNISSKVKKHKSDRQNNTTQRNGMHMWYCC